MFPRQLCSSVSQTSQNTTSLHSVSRGMTNLVAVAGIALILRILASLVALLGIAAMVLQPLVWKARHVLSLHYCAAVLLQSTIVIASLLLTLQAGAEGDKDSESIPVCSTYARIRLAGELVMLAMVSLLSWGPYIALRGGALAWSCSFSPTDGDQLQNRARCVAMGTCLLIWGIAIVGALFENRPGTGAGAGASAGAACISDQSNSLRALMGLVTILAVILGMIVSWGLVAKNPGRNRRIARILVYLLAVLAGAGPDVITWLSPGGRMTILEVCLSGGTLALTILHVSKEVGTVLGVRRADAIEIIGATGAGAVFAASPHTNGGGDCGASGPAGRPMDGLTDRGRHPSGNLGASLHVPRLVGRPDPMSVQDSPPGLFCHRHMRRGGVVSPVPMAMAPLARNDSIDLVLARTFVPPSQTPTPSGSPSRMPLPHVPRLSRRAAVVPVPGCLAPPPSPLSPPPSPVSGVGLSGIGPARPRTASLQPPVLHAAP